MIVDTFDLAKHGRADRSGSSSASAAMASLLAAGNLYIPEGTWLSTAAVPVPAGRRVVMHPSAVIQIASGATHSAVFTASGSVGAFASVGGALGTASETVTFPSGVGSLAVGDRIVVRSSADTLDHENDPHPAELKEVIGISGNDVTFDSPLVWSQTTPEWAKVTTVDDLTFDGIRVSNPSAALVRDLDVQYSGRLKVHDWGSEKSGGGLMVTTAWQPHLCGVDIDGSVWTPTNGVDNFRGYGVYVRGQVSLGAVQSVTQRGGRHAVTTNVDGANFGGAVGLQVSDSYALGTGNAGFDTHQGSAFVRFSNCLVRGAGIFGFRFRGDYHTAVGCEAVGRQTSGYNWTDGGVGGRVLSSSARDCATAVRATAATYDVDVTVGAGCVSTGSFVAPTQAVDGLGVATVTNLAPTGAIA